MGRIVSNFFISLDGVVERPDQWHFPYFDDAMGEIVGAGMSTTSGLPDGPQAVRRVVRVLARAGSEVPFSEFINAHPEVRRVHDPAGRVLEQHHGGLRRRRGRAAQIKESTDGDIGDVRQRDDRALAARQRAARRAGLLMHPIAVGSGQRLFEDTPDPPADAAALADARHRRAAPALRAGVVLTEDACSAAARMSAGLQVRGRGGQCRSRSTCSARCPRARRCWRPAPAPARRSPSPPWSRATSPTGSRWRSCSSSASAASRPASCASGSASGWSAPATGWPTRRPSPADDRVLAQLADADADGARRTAATAGGGTHRLRRRDRHHHARLLPAGAARARHRRRPRHRRGARREHRRPGGRGGRRPLPAQVGHAGLRPGGHDPRRVPRRSRWPPRRTPPPSCCPTPATDGMPGQRARIAAAVRAEVDRRKRRQQLIDYDDMLIRLGDTLTDPTSGPVACGRLRTRYRVVLVDEFQDTDPVQWTILREAFHGHRTLVLIGDPKQAIYGFRGADVHAYLEAPRVGVSRAHPADQLAQRRAAARRDGRGLRRRRARRRADPGAAGRGRARRAGWSTRVGAGAAAGRAARRADR